LLFDGKSIRKEEDTVKDKNRAEGKGTRGDFKENGTIQVWTVQIKVDNRKRKSGSQFLTDFSL
jgi:hypothetical protein